MKVNDHIYDSRDVLAGQQIEAAMDKACGEPQGEVV
jgi:hypothetical protein